MDPDVREAVCVILRLLSEERYDLIERRTRGRRLDATEIGDIVATYPERPVRPQRDWEDFTSVLELATGAGPRAVAVTVDIASDRSSSNLGLEMTLRECGPDRSWDCVIDNLYVV